MHSGDTVILALITECLKNSFDPTHMQIQTCQDVNLYFPSNGLDLPVANLLILKEGFKQSWKAKRTFWEVLPIGKTCLKDIQYQMWATVEDFLCEFQSPWVVVIEDYYPFP